MAEKRARKRSATRKVDPHAEELRVLRKDPWCAAALRSGMPLEQVRQAYAGRHPKPPPDPLDRLREISEELRAAEARRRALVRERSELVDQLRREGQPWSVLAAAAHVARPTLIQAGIS